MIADRMSAADLNRLTVEIYFIVDGKDYARRRWPCVPPVGAHVMMHPQTGPEKYEVTAVLWGVNRDDTDMLTCNVALKKLGAKRGRPRLHPDRKAYKAEKERQRRARLKAEKEGKPA